MIPDALPGQFVTLELLNSSHREALRATAPDSELFKYFSYFAGGTYFDAQFDDALNKLEKGLRIPFAVRRNVDGAIVGSTSFYDLFPHYQRLAIGHTWYIPDARGSAVNPEAKYLLLCYAFETLAFERVEFYADIRNTHSCAAIKKLGAHFEGILRAHLPMPMEKDHRRDTAMFSIIRNEWPRIKQNLRQRLNEISLPV